VSTTVKSQVRLRPPCHGIRVRPSGRLPSMRVKPAGSFVAGTSEGAIDEVVQLLVTSRTARTSFARQTVQSTRIDGGATRTYYYYSFGNAPLCRRLTDVSEERVVFLGGHPSKVCAVCCVQYSVPLSGILLSRPVSLTGYYCFA
jgi:hypothetical protein